MTPNFFWFLACLCIAAVVCGAMGQWIAALVCLIIAGGAVVCSFAAFLACVSILLLLRWFWRGKW